MLKGKIWIINESYWLDVDIVSITPILLNFDTWFFVVCNDYENKLQLYKTKDLANINLK